MSLLARPMKQWEIIAEKLSASGLSWGCSSEIDATGRVLYTADAYRNDDKLAAFLELERVNREPLGFCSTQDNPVIR